MTGPAYLRLGRTDLKVFPLVLGTNVFGWTADESASHAVLDAYVAAGGNLIDTADSYSTWVPENVGGESETIIGNWFRSRGRRDDVLIATKVSQHPDFMGLAPANIRAAANASLARLGTNVIDLYYAHFDDPHIPLEETIGTLSALVDEGKVRYLGVSNFSAQRLEEWVRTTEDNGFHLPVALQQRYSLVERDVEQTTLPIARREGWAFLPYHALARGFLTGKYTSGEPVDSPRADSVSAYLDERGKGILAAMDKIARDNDVPMAAIALAWVASQPGVTAPIASARNPEQLQALIASASLVLTESDLAILGDVS